MLNCQSGSWSQNRLYAGWASTRDDRASTCALNAMEHVVSHYPNTLPPSRLEADVQQRQLVSKVKGLRPPPLLCTEATLQVCALPTPRLQTQQSNMTPHRLRRMKWSCSACTLYQQVHNSPAILLQSKCNRLGTRTTVGKSSHTMRSWCQDHCTAWHSQWLAQVSGTSSSSKMKATKKAIVVSKREANGALVQLFCFHVAPRQIQGQSYMVFLAL